MSTRSVIGDPCAQKFCTANRKDPSGALSTISTVESLLAIKISKLLPNGSSRPASFHGSNCLNMGLFVISSHLGVAARYNTCGDERSAKFTVLPLLIY